MTYGVPLSSARDQWYQWTYAVLPNGNWDAGGQHLCILDNGEVWVHMTRLTSYFNPLPWDTTLLPQYQTIGETPFNWLGRVHPLGNERVNGDEMAYGAEPGTQSDTYGLPYPKVTDSYLPETGIAYRGANANAGMLVSDGTFVYLYAMEGDGAPAEKRELWYKIDPTTLMFERIAGTSINGVPYVDAPIGLNASFWLPGQAVFHGGYIYMVDSWEGPGQTAMGRTVRRMSLTPPYGVETVTPDFNTPTGYPGAAGATTWFNTINSATGLPNVYNDDALFNVGSSTQITGFQIWDGYMYFMSEVRAGTRTYFYLKRCLLSGGALETLLYGFGIDLVSSPDYRDNRNDSADFPNGFLVNGVWQPSHYYTPDLEGFSPSYTSMLVDPDGNLYAQNLTGSRFQAGSQQYGTRIVRFRLPDLIATYQADGPQRINREDPQWDTLNNGTVFWEGGASLGVTSPQYVQRRWWSSRDGTNPLISHILVTGWGLNWNSQQWNKKIVFLHPEIANTVAPIEDSYSTANAMMVGVLQEEGGGPMDLRLNFEGTALKAYGYQPGMAEAYCPEEVVLT